jgi:hypothetical protein
VTVVVPRSLSLPPRSANRSFATFAGLALIASVAFLFRRLAPGAPAIIPAGFAGVSGLAALALAFTLNDAALPKFTRAVAAGVGLLLLCALLGPDTRLRLASFASAAFGLGLAVWLVRTARKRPGVSWPLAALFAVTLGLLSAYAAHLVLASRHLMIADFMTYRGVAIMVARLIDAGNWPLLLTAGVQSITQDYSWASGFIPGLLLALTEPTSRAIYTFPLLALYAAPATLALAVLARDCARRASSRATLNSSGLAPITGLPRAPRVDLDELGRLKDWVDRRAQPGAKVCGLGSSYTFSGQLIGELCQLRPERGPSGAKLGAAMPDVDTVDGPPGAGLKDCAIIIVGDPIQTHLDPNYQQTVIAPSREMLSGQGIGAKFRRTGEIFHLENGVSAVVFERLAPLDDADIAALQARWRAARAALGF